jgi:hypothetical protein
MKTTVTETKTLVQEAQTQLPGIYVKGATLSSPQPPNCLSCVSWSPSEEGLKTFLMTLPVVGVAFAFDFAYRDIKAGHYWSAGVNTTFGALGTFGGAALYQGALKGLATETFYRTMSQADYRLLLASGRLPPTPSGTFISPSAEYALRFDGITVEFRVEVGTTEELLGMGVRNAGTRIDLPLAESGWGSTSAMFKFERGVMNIGLGQAPALNTFNDSILSFHLVPR